MFAVKEILVSDDLFEARFACDLVACRGACCVHGDSGAPLLPEERERVDEVLPVVRPFLRAEALDVIDRQGAWEEVAPGQFATSCCGTEECVFVVYDGLVAKCAIQQAWASGKTTFRKPISCHLYPIRVSTIDNLDVINYEQIDLCEGGRRSGERGNVLLADYLEEPLTRKYGEDWYRLFKEIVAARRTMTAETREQ